MRKTGTSTGWLSVARWLALAGVIGAIVLGLFSYQTLQNRLDALSRVAVPGQVTIEIPELRQGLTIYYEDPTARGGLVEAGGSNTLASSPLDLTVTGPSGESVATVPYERDLRFDHDGRVVTALATIDTPTAGTYTVQASGNVPPTAMVSVGRVVDFGLIAAWTGTIALFVGSLLLVLVTVTVAAINRRKVGTRGRPEYE